MLLTRKGLLSSLSWTFKLLTSNLCVKRLFHMEGYYTSPSATAFSRASNTSLAGNWCLMHWKSSKIARGWDWGELFPLLLVGERSPPFSYSQIATELCREMQKEGLHLGGQGTDMLTYFYHRHVLDISRRPKPSFVQCVLQTYSWKMGFYRLGESACLCHRAVWVGVPQLGHGAWWCAGWMSGDGFYSHLGLGEHARSAQNMRGHAGPHRRFV